MSGRVGRMGTDHDGGRVVFSVKGYRDIPVAKDYLNTSRYPTIDTHITPDHFEQLSLQLICAGLCETRQELSDFVQFTLSGTRENDRNHTQFIMWIDFLNQIITRLIENKHILEAGSGRLVGTSLGRATTQAGMQPISTAYLLSYIGSQYDNLIALLPTEESDGNFAAFTYVFFYLCLNSPEFIKYEGARKTRSFDWTLSKSPHAPLAEQFEGLLVDPNWMAELAPANAAQLGFDWIQGTSIRELENRFPSLSAGVLHESFRNLSWMLQGVGNVLAAVTDSRYPKCLRPESIQLNDTQLINLRRVPRLLNRLAYEVSEGLPSNLLWMKGIAFPDGSGLSRDEILALQENGIDSPEVAMRSDPEMSSLRKKAFAKNKNPQQKSNEYRDAVKGWKSTQRIQAKERHLKRAKQCSHKQLIGDYYSSYEIAFERAFENCLMHLNINFDNLDVPGKIGAPDYLLKFDDGSKIVVEVKSKPNGKMVPYNSATEVLAASEIHGYKDTFCVTLCHLGVDPAVPGKIIQCSRLAVVESSDLGEALLRICEGKLSKEQFYEWLSQPGQCLARDIPFTSYFV